LEKKIPDDPKEFEELMQRIDRQLSSEGVSIFRRPSHACSAISKEFKILLLLSPPLQGCPKELAESWPITERIRNWYKLQYGDRLRSSPCVGSMAFLIDNDVWVFHFPRIFGSVQFVASHTIKSNHIGTKGKPVIHNVLDSIDRLAEGLRLSLTDKQLDNILNYFHLGFDALCGLGAFYEDSLIRSALADIDTSIKHMIDQNPEYGLSKWSSLQASEKMIKATINMSHAKFSKTHELSKLLTEAQQAGVKLDIDNLIGKIQCNPRIRYGQEPCTLSDAINAHHAVFMVAIEVIKELQRFRTAIK